MPPRVVAGLSLGPDSAAALFVDGLLVSAVRQSMVDRVPNSAAFPSGALDAALDVAKLRGAEVATIGVAGLTRTAEGVRARLRDLVTRSLPAGGVVGTARVRAAAAKAPEARTMPEVARRLDEARIAAELHDVRAGELAAALQHLARAATHPLVHAALAQPSAAAIGAAAFVLTNPAVHPRLPVGPPRWGPTLSDGMIYRALSNAKLPRLPADDPEGIAAGFLARGIPVAWARGAVSFSDADCETRALRRPHGREPEALLGPDGVIAVTPTDIIRAWRLIAGAALVVGGYVIPPR
jgi:predicted NodU family carbamoyl transferase